MTSQFCGFNLSSDHYNEFLSLPKSPLIEWVEIHPENFYNKTTENLEILEHASKNYHLSFHCVGLSLGSTDGLNQQDMLRLKELTRSFKPKLISDHLSWCSVGGQYFHELMPLPYTYESLENFVKKVSQVQDILGEQLLIENPSLYVTFQENNLSETEFLNQLTKATGCGILLDVNNLYISSRNLKFKTQQYLDSLDSNDIKQIHLAGFNEIIGPGQTIIDTHSSIPSKEVMELYALVLKKMGKLPTIFEQDQNLTTLNNLINQLQPVHSLLEKV